MDGLALVTTRQPALFDGQSWRTAVNTTDTGTFCRSRQITAPNVSIGPPRSPLLRVQVDGRPDTEFEAGEHTVAVTAGVVRIQGRGTIRVFATLV